MNKRKKVAAIDFDGVIHKYSQGWKNGVIYDDIVQGAKEGLKSLKDAGFYILIYTTRTNLEYRKKGEPDQITQIINYLEKNEIPYDSIYVGQGKPMADIYLDDRAINFNGDWGAAVELIKNFKPWNRPHAKSSAELNAFYLNKK